jgi:peptidoglycan/xylan/chitin deacetylase (PgdA/CDA1 family)
MWRALSFGLVRLADLLLPNVVFFGKTTRKVVALTLDDGPHETVTEDVLNLLDEHDARATFFLLGSRAERAPEALLERIAERHELGNHSWEDEFSALVPKAELKARVARTGKILSSFGEVRYFRPGKGWPTPKVLKIAAGERYRCVLGSIYPNDVRVRSDRRVVDSVLDQIRPGAIIILHEGTAERARIVPILREVLAELRDRRYRVTTVSELLALP